MTMVTVLSGRLGSFCYCASGSLFDLTVDGKFPKTINSPGTAEYISNEARRTFRDLERRKMMRVGREGLDGASRVWQVSVPVYRNIRKSRLRLEVDVARTP